MNTQTTVKTSRRQLRRLLAGLVLMLFFACLPGARASAASTGISDHYYDYEVTMQVGDTLTLYGLAYRASNTGAYSDTSRPRAFFAGATGYNVASLSPAYSNASHSGREGSSNSYSCDIDLTIQAMEPGTAVVSYDFGGFATVAGYTADIYLPRITIHVVESGDVSVSRAVGAPYSAVPRAVREHMHCTGWFTEPTGGEKVDDYTAKAMYAHWRAGFDIVIEETAGEKSPYTGDYAVYETRQAVIPYDAETGNGQNFLNHFGSTFGFQIPDYYYYKNSGITLEPQWEIQELTDSGTEFSIQPWYEDKWLLRSDGVRPQSAMDVRLRITCSWLGMTEQFELLIHFVDVPLPTGADIPVFIDIPLFQWGAVECHFDNGYVFDNRVWFSGDVNGDAGRLVELFNWYNDGNTLYISRKTAQPGWYAGFLDICDGNVSIGKPVFFRVLNADGSVPELQLQLSVYVPGVPETTCPIENGEFTLYQAVIPPEAENETLDHDNFLCIVDVQDYDALQARLGGEPEIRVRELTNTGTEITVSRGTMLRTSKQRPHEPTQAQFEVSCDWGGLHGSFLLNMIYEKVPFPTGTDIPPVIDLQVGKDSVFNFHFSDGYAYKNHIWFTGALGDGDGEAFNNQFVLENMLDGLHLMPKSPGYYSGRLTMVDTNIGYRVPVVFRVADEAGNIPEPAPFFDLRGEEIHNWDCMLGTLDDNVSEGWLTRNTLFAWILDNLPELRAAYGENPAVSWSIEYVSGVRAALHVLPLEAEGLPSGACRIFIDALPEVTGTSRYDLVCTWEGHTSRLPIQIRFFAKPERLPQDIAFPSRFTIPVGESKYRPVFYEKGEYDVTNNETIFNLWDEGIADVRRMPDPHFVTITGLKAGNAHARLYVGCYQNAAFVKNIEIHVVDEVIRLPEGLTGIESQAFGSVRDVAVYIPDSVSEIAEDAFDPSVTCVCAEGSYANERCRELGLMVITK